MPTIISERVSGKSADYGFDVEPKIAADALRKIADRIESREVILQKYTAFRRATLDDYEMTGVVLVFAERFAPSEEGEQR